MNSDLERRTRERRRAGRPPGQGADASSDQEQVPITALCRDLTGRLCHSFCGSPLALQHMGRMEAVFRCFRCLEHVYVPVRTLPRIPTRASHSAIWPSPVAAESPAP
jgi:hypothetical protein